MKQNKNIAPFDNLVMAYITKENQGGLTSSYIDNEAEIVFAKEFEATLSKEKVEAMLLSLSTSLAKDTLGSLVQKAISEKATTIEILQSNTGLTTSILDGIKTDMVFTNSIPVKSLAKLLKFLNVSLDNAQEAINATFEKLSIESKLFLTTPAKVQPAFRKGMSNNSTGFDFIRMKSDESYLYQNKEALEKYTKRLSELYNEF